MASLGRLAARGAGVTFGAQLTRFALQIVSLAVLSRILTPAQVGLVAMVTAILNVAEIVRDFGLSAAAVSAKTVSIAERSNLFWLNLAIGTACSVVAVALAPVLARLYGEPEVQGIAYALAGLFVVSGANTQYRADLSRAMRFSALAITDIGAQSVSVIVSIVAALSGAGYWAIVLQQATFVISTFAINLVQCSWLPGRPRRDVSVRAFARTGSHLLGTNLLGFAVNNIDNVGIGAVWGPTAVGLYSRAFQLLQVPLQQVNAPLSRVVLPVLSQLHDQPEVFDRFFQRFQLALCYALGLGFAVLAGVSDPLVHVLFGPAWAGAAPILAVLACSGIFRGIDSANYQLWVAKGLTGKLLKFYLVSRPIMILCILAGLPWGPIGVAFAHLVVAVAHWAVGLRYVCVLAGTDWRPILGQSVRTMLLVIGPAGLVAWAATQIVAGPVLRLAAGVAAGLLWAVVSTALIPPVRRSAAPLVSVALRAVRSAA
ncbi:lipopolysaccharide biosynthesis protein [Terrabacter sp. Ter38]|uniref:lipopolysaccharide biosynthesis protein n=1 Tax=Terrabacter sp. Ter38 TaxID=2926030 RepID=UPI002117A112|nr:lipopolysaccharide biosynthesis protein [Terrabacter sp. Ter38]